MGYLQLLGEEPWYFQERSLQGHSIEHHLPRRLLGWYLLRYCHSTYGQLGVHEGYCREQVQGLGTNGLRDRCPRSLPQGSRYSCPHDRYLVPHDASALETTTVVESRPCEDASMAQKFSF